MAAQSIKYILLILTLLLRWSNSDQHSPLEGLEALLRAEQQLVKHVETYLNKETQRLEVLKDFLDRQEKVSLSFNNEHTGDLTNPLAAYKAIRRITLDWVEFGDFVLNDTHSQDFLAAVELLENSTALDMANDDDLREAALDVLILQETKNIPTADLANRKLRGTDVSLPLTPGDCHELGRELYNAEEFEMAMAWFHQAKNLFTQQHNDTNSAAGGDHTKLELSNIQLNMAYTAWHLENCKLAIRIAVDILEEKPLDEKALEILDSCTEELRSERRTAIVQHLHMKKLQEESIDIDNDLKIKNLYESTCRGEVSPTPAQQRALRCRYASHDVPFHRIAPFKEEELSLDPYIALYHDAMHEYEMAYLIEASAGSLEVSGVEGDEDVWRVSENTWVPFAKHASLRKLQQRLAAITRLNMDNSEPLQVAQYSIGGFYGPHYDESDPTEENDTREELRILTAMFYISDVELGGATAFPLLKLRVQPVKGNLLVWYNLHKSGSVDFRTLHAGCPVIRGTKWVCNAWLFEEGQEFLRPCELSPDEGKSRKHKAFFDDLRSDF